MKSLLSTIVFYDSGENLVGMTLRYVQKIFAIFTDSVHSGLTPECSLTDAEQHRARQKHKFWPLLLVILMQKTETER